MNPTMNVSKIIDLLGGTAVVARLCRIQQPSVSEWKSQNHIPSAREQLLRVLRPDVFASEAAERGVTRHGSRSAKPKARARA